MDDHRQEPEISTSGLIAHGHVNGTTNPFALPIGLKGRLAGWYMGRPDAQHRELAAIVPLDGRTRLVEIGFGPGQLLEMFHDRVPQLAMAGVDPSELMVRRARRHNPHADLQLGAAAAMPFPDGHADLMISVNNIPMWPDLDAGLMRGSARDPARRGGVARLARGARPARSPAPSRTAARAPDGHRDSDPPTVRTDERQKSPALDRLGGLRSRLRATLTARIWCAPHFLQRWEPSRRLACR